MANNSLIPSDLSSRGLQTHGDWLTGARFFTGVRFFTGARFFLREYVFYGSTFFTGVRGDGRTFFYGSTVVRKLGFYLSP